MITTLSAILIGLGVTPVRAQSGPHIGGWPSPAEQRALTREPGYSVGTGAVHTGSRPNQSHAKTQKRVATQPRYNAGVAAARTNNK